jgi:hypothetical protein
MDNRGFAGLQVCWAVASLVAVLFTFFISSRFDHLKYVQRFRLGK